MNKQYTLKSSFSNIEAIKSKVIQDLNERIAARQDCKVMIQSLDFRSMPALKAYWVMVGNVVKWDADNHGYKADVWDEWFKREAGLYDNLDQRNFWRIKYKSELGRGWVIDDKNGYFLLYKPDMTKSKENWEYYHRSEDPSVYLGNRFIEKTRSISNKGDVTKDEMSRLLMTVIKFGDDNIHGWIGIKDTELEHMLRSYGR